eukprot:204128_1
MNKLAAIYAFACITITVADQNHAAYSDSVNLGNNNQNWMASLCNTGINRVSIPGTHDTIADDNDGSLVDCQSMALPNQLNAGIRALDIRCKIGGSNYFTVFHGDYYLSAVFGDVMRDTVSFLDSNPKEFIVMRVSHEGGGDNNKFAEIFNLYFNDARYRNYFYKDPSENYNTIPLVTDVRKKIVVFQGFPSSGGYGPFGFNYPSSSSGLFDIQDSWSVSGKDGAHNKWNDHVKPQLDDANSNRNSGKFYVNYFSGAMTDFSWPFYTPSSVACGERFCYDACPKICVIVCWDPTCEFCAYDYEGINILGYNHMASKSFVGYIMIDFPGAALIDRIVEKNDFCPSTISSLSSGYFILQNKRSGNCIYLNGANLGYKECNNDDDTYFSAYNINSGYFQIRSKHSGNCIVNRGHGGAKGYVEAPDGWTFAASSCGGWNDQKFKAVYVSGNYFMLKNKVTSRCIYQNNPRFGIAGCNTGYQDQLWKALSTGLAVDSPNVIPSEYTPYKTPNKFIGSNEEIILHIIQGVIVALILINVLCVLYYCCITKRYQHQPKKRDFL